MPQRKCCTVAHDTGPAVVSCCLRSPFWTQIVGEKAVEKFGSSLIAQQKHNTHLVFDGCYSMVDIDVCGQTATLPLPLRLLGMLQLEC